MPRVAAPVRKAIGVSYEETAYYSINDFSICL